MVELKRTTRVKRVLANCMIHPVLQHHGGKTEAAGRRQRALAVVSIAAQRNLPLSGRHTLASPSNDHLPGERRRKLKTRGLAAALIGTWGPVAGQLRGTKCVMGDRECTHFSRPPQNKVVPLFFFDRMHASSHSPRKSCRTRRRSSSLGRPPTSPFYSCCVCLGTGNGRPLYKWVQP